MLISVCACVFSMMLCFYFSFTSIPIFSSLDFNLLAALLHSASALHSPFIADWFVDSLVLFFESLGVSLSIRLDEVVVVVVVILG